MTATGPPAWLPASVGRAYARGSETGDDLEQGRAWESLLAALRRAGSSLDADRASGYRHLLVLLAIGIDEALRRGDPYDPVLRPGSTDAVLKWGMDCPDALYLGAPVRGDAVYRVGGTRGSVRYLGFQVMSGIASTANVVADELTIDGNGRFELLISAEEQPGNWMPLAADASSLVVRQFFYDWEREEPAELSISVIGGGKRPREAAPLDPAGVARQLVALGEFVEGSLAFWRGLDEQLHGRAPNRFAEPDARTDLGGAAENVTVWGSWEVGPDEALIIEVAPPEAMYWSVALGNRWWESLDYANHQCSLNGYQAAIDADGVFRAVIAHRDPGVANWLDPAGHESGPMIMRYVRAAQAPVPETRLVRVDSLDVELPPDMPRVDAEARRRAISGRRAGVQRRFAR
jgi:hypothetical protein